MARETSAPPSALWSASLDAGRSYAPREFDEDLEVALSGGGFRATAYGLGVLLYLAHSGLNRRVATIASVSGGSLTNGFVASECDYGSLKDVDEFRRVAARLARIVSGRGRFRGFWLVSRPYIALLFVTGAALAAWLAIIAAALAARIGWGVSLRPVSRMEVLAWAVAALLWGVAALCREYVVRAWMADSFFRRRGTALQSLSGRKVDHVFCATDLISSVPLFFSTKGEGRLFSESYGRGYGGDVTLALAVASSAAFPPLIPPMQLTLGGRDFTRGDGVPRKVYLSDGGVWNNLGTDWSRLRSELLTAETSWNRTVKREDDLHALQEGLKECPAGGVLLIANASKPEPKRNPAIFALFKVPVASLVWTVLRVLNVAVNSTIHARSADVEKVARLRMLNDPDRWELGADAPRPQGTVWGEGRGTDLPLAIAVEMTRRPGETAAAYSMVGGLAQWTRGPEEYQRSLEAPLRDLQPLLDGDGVVPTTFDNIGRRDTLRMIVSGYLTTRETLTVAFGNHTPPPIPARGWFEELLDGDPRDWAAVR